MTRMHTGAALSGQPTIGNFRAAVQKIPSAIAILTATAEGRELGLTVTGTSICAVPTDPAGLVLAVNAASPLVAMMRASGRCAISFLPETLAQLARAHLDPRACGTPRFDPALWSRRTPDSPPWLDAAIAAMDCRIVHEQAEGIHLIITARVEGVLSTEAEGLMYRDGLLRRLEPKG